MHHIMLDGCGTVSFLANLVDEHDARYLPLMRTISTKDKVLLYLTVPFNLIKMSLQMLFLSKNHNPIANGKPLSGVRKCSFAKEYTVT